MLGFHLLLTPQEYRELIKEENIKKYFQEKIKLLRRRRF